MICEEPNKFARPLQLHLDDQSVIFQGYQEFVLNRDSIHVLAEDLSLQKKQELLAPFFNPRYLKTRTVLDLGSNAGFFSFWALQQGAAKAICVDMDQQYVEAAQTAGTHLGFSNLDYGAYVLE